MTPVTPPLSSDPALALAGATTGAIGQFVHEHVSSESTGAIAADLHGKLVTGTLNQLASVQLADAGVGSRVDHST